MAPEPEMQALEQPYAPASTRLLERTPVRALVGLALAWLAAVAALPAPAARVVGLAVAHGALLGTAVAWTAAGRRGRLTPPLEAAGLLAAAAVCAQQGPWGLLAYLAVPAWLVARRGVRWARVGEHLRAALTGGAFGCLLGLHLCVNASLTLGHRLHPGAPIDLLGWLAYDVGANVLAAEVFFRGALFTRAHRRWSFAASAGLSTAASVARYLLDPLLPRSPEILVGATFYLALLGTGNCWLMARTGSAAGPLAAGLVFFAAYRLLAH